MCKLELLRVLSNLGLAAKGLGDGGSSDLYPVGVSPDADSSPLEMFEYFRLFNAVLDNSDC